MERGGRAQAAGHTVRSDGPDGPAYARRAPAFVFAAVRLTMPAPRRYRNISDLPAVIPVFPLTGVILLPRARLPLNVFEPRYLAMVDAAMDHYRVIGVIQPRVPGGDKAKDPPLASVGCVGRITDYSETDDGRYLITLTGIARFQVSGERDSRTPYREVAADYALFANDLHSTEDPPIARDRLLAALKPYLSDR